MNNESLGVKLLPKTSPLLIYVDNFSVLWKFLRRFFCVLLCGTSLKSILLYFVLLVIRQQEMFILKTHLVFKNKKYFLWNFCNVFFYSHVIKTCLSQLSSLTLAFSPSPFHQNIHCRIQRNVSSVCFEKFPLIKRGRKISLDSCALNANHNENRFTWHHAGFFHSVPYYASFRTVASWTSLWTRKF